MCRHMQSAVTFNGKVYIAGGCDGAQDCHSGFCSCASLTTDLALYDPSLNSWSRLPPLPNPRYRHAACVWRDSFFLFSGRHSDDSIVTEVDMFNITNRTWSTLPSSSMYPWDLGSDNTCVTLGDTIFVIGMEAIKTSWCLGHTSTSPPALCRRLHPYI